MDEQTSLQRKQSILEYWTLVEFFSPYLLESVLDFNQSYLRVHAEPHLNDPLPWLNTEIFEEDDPFTPFAQGYHLYLGLFNIEETADLARHSFAKEESQWQSTNWRNCGKENSMTVFARLTATTHGIPILGTLSLSTLPWAHGSLLNEKKGFLTIEQYWKGVNRLLTHLREEFIPKLPKKLMKKPSLKAEYLDFNSLMELMKILYHWAGFHPIGYPIALIRKIDGDQTQAVKEPKINSERDIPILNSFYIQDLEAASKLLPDQQGWPIDLYLNGKQEEMRIAIDSEEGKKIVLTGVRPERIPAGRWPDPLSHRQSLMQQFAINKVFELLNRKGVFSINGPPGTGKTSLLREIIAENIVGCATVLSQFKNVKDAFVAKHSISFEAFDRITVSELHPALVGYEMLIVSSNNAAVQNLSQELPRRFLIDSKFSHASYLESVATRMFNGQENNVWGLISAAFGNRQNCQRFVENIFTIPSGKNGLRIWEWVDEYQGLSFSEAKEIFISIKEKQERLYEELNRLAFLHDEIDRHSVESYCAAEMKALMDAEESSAEMDVTLSKLLTEELECKELLALLIEKENLLKEQSPGALDRLIDRKSFRKWEKDLNSVRKEKLAAIEQLQVCKIALKNMAEQCFVCGCKVDRLLEELFDKAVLFHCYQGVYLSLKELHPELNLPKGLENFEEKNIQTQSYYQTDEINQVRSELFIAALVLHEAWLAETLSAKGEFRGNLMAISKILQGKSPTTADDTRRVWQSVFLLVPVISSTFASVGRLFRHLESKSFGWVLIDEAGQASPQAAVGAIWRAQRVVSIGDPFQIEPICPIPGEIVDGMAKHKIQDNMLNWAPSQISVQTLMDQINPYGVERMLREESCWIGSPLRVHRRCLDPMFSISNTIAYDESMVLATDPEQDLSLPSSCWWDVGGYVKGRQYVQEQGEALALLLKDAFVQMKIPSMYVISPFYEVASKIQNHLKIDKELHEIFKQQFPSFSYSLWLQQNIGTVHTFQGKQAQVVYFILGADRSTLGAIDWASKKPNLLNVAVTRACWRFYIIGDYKLWKVWPYFDVAAKKLERRTLSEPLRI